MATNADFIAALDAAIAGGLKSVTVEGVTTTWQDVDQMLRARAFYAGQAETENGAVSLRRIPLQIGQGLGQGIGR